MGVSQRISCMAILANQIMEHVEWTFELLSNSAIYEVYSSICSDFGKFRRLSSVHDYWNRTANMV